MGEVIRKDAAVEDIFDDLRETIARAKARPGPFASHAEAVLEPVLALIGPVEAERKQAEQTLAPLMLTLAVADDDADHVIAESADRIWNALGRPGRDAGYDLLFPGGNTHYVDGDVAEQPYKMALLVTLLRSGVHPRLDRALASELADKIDAAGKRLEVAYEATRAPRTRATLLARTTTALARTAAMELARYKRRLLADGVGEVEIHTVIPDRPRAKRTSPAPEATRAG